MPLHLVKAWFSIGFFLFYVLFVYIIHHNLNLCNCHTNRHPHGLRHAGNEAPALTGRQGRGAAL